jgi:anti-sigma factor RsiW
MSERMDEHVSRWIAAYCDGELSGAKLRQVKAHLAGCPACRREVEDLRALSAMLHASPAHQPRTRADRFAAQVALRLPPAGSLADANRPPRRSFWRLAWQSVPLVLIVSWAFIQAVVLVTTPALVAFTSSPSAQAVLAELTRLAPAALSALMPGVPFMGELLPGSALAGWVLPLSEIVLLNLFFTVATAIMFAAWLAIWWIDRREESWEAF